MKQNKIHSHHLAEKKEEKRRRRRQGRKKEEMPWAEEKLTREVILEASLSGDHPLSTGLGKYDKFVAWLLTQCQDPTAKVADAGEHSFIIFPVVLPHDNLKQG